jgi:Na+-driven multidrug efflux pump
MAIKGASIQISKLFVNAYINSYGLAVSGFAGIANKIGSISNLVSNSLNTAGSSMVGQNIGAKEYKRVPKIVLCIALLTFGMASVFSLAICLFPMQVYGIFTTDPAVLEVGLTYLPIAVLIFFGSAARSPMNALINGTGNYGVNFATAILDGIVMRIGLSVLFGLVLHMESFGFWLGDALAGFTPFFIGIVYYVTGLWKRERE